MTEWIRKLSKVALAPATAAIASLLLPASASARAEDFANPPPMCAPVLPVLEGLSSVEKSDVVTRYLRWQIAESYEEIRYAPTLQESFAKRPRIGAGIFGGYRSIERTDWAPWRFRGAAEPSAALRISALSPGGARALAATLVPSLGVHAPVLRLVRNTHFPGIAGMVGMAAVPPRRELAFAQIVANGAACECELVLTVDERTLRVVQISSTLVEVGEEGSRPPTFLAADAEAAFLSVRPLAVIGFLPARRKTELRMFAQPDGAARVVYAVPFRHPPSCSATSEPGRRPYLAAIDANNLALLGFFPWNEFVEGKQSRGGACGVDPNGVEMPID